MNARASGFLSCGATLVADTRRCSHSSPVLPRATSPLAHTRRSLILVVLTAESWGLLIGGVCMEPKTTQVGGGIEEELSLVWTECQQLALSRWWRSPAGVARAMSLRRLGWSTALAPCGCFTLPPPFAPAPRVLASPRFATHTTPDDHHRPHLGLPVGRRLLRAQVRGGAEPGGGCWLSGSRFRARLKPKSCPAFLASSLPLSHARSIPVWIGWIKYLSFLYWGYNLFTKSQFRCMA
jgi:hypothetical protein